MPSETMDLWRRQLREVMLGAPLTSVEFVQDYLQLKFDGPMLTIITWPVVEIEGYEFRWDQKGFRDEICSRIGERVIDAEILPGDSFQLTFSDGAIVRVSLKDADYRAAEAIRFEAGPSTWWSL